MRLRLTPALDEAIWAARYLARRDAECGVFRSARGDSVGNRVMRFIGEPERAKLTGPKGFGRSAQYVLGWAYGNERIALADDDEVTDYGRIRRAMVLDAKADFDRGVINPIKLDRGTSWYAAEYFLLIRKTSDWVAYDWPTDEETYDWAEWGMTPTVSFEEFMAEVTKDKTEEGRLASEFFEKARKALEAWKNGETLPEGAEFKDRDGMRYLYVDDKLIGIASVPK